jgi:hypothetical protein
MNKLAMTGILSAALGCANPAWAEGPWTPYYRNFPGQDIKAHYVHLALAVAAANEEVERKNLAADYQLCKHWKEVIETAGMPSGSLAPPPELPAHPLSSDLEIYYGPEHSATFLSMTTNFIDLGDNRLPFEQMVQQTDCGMKKQTTKTLRLRSGAEICDIDMVNMQLKPSAYCTGSIAIPSGAAGRQLAESIARSRSMLAAGPQPLPSMTGFVQAVGGANGETKTIVGLKCRGYGSTQLGRLCVATPRSSFPYPPAQPHEIWPGVLLEDIYPATGWTYTAQEAVLEMSVGAGLFARPAGLTTAQRNTPGRRSAP